MSTTEKYAVLGTAFTLMGTELNSLANNSLAVSSSAFNNVAGGGSGDGYVLADIELVVTFGTNPTANTAVSLWWLKSVDGTNFESTSAAPTRSPNLSFGVAVSTSAQRLILPQIVLPFGTFKVLIQNAGTGQAFASSANTLKINPATYSGA